MKHCRPTIEVVYQTRYFKASGIVMLDPGRGLGYPSYFCSLVLIFGPVWIIHGNIFLENPIYNIVAFACTCSNTQITLQKFMLLLHFTKSLKRHRIHVLYSLDAR